MSRSARAQESKLEALRAAAKANPADPNTALALGDALRLAARWNETFAELRRGIAVAGARAGESAALHQEVARAYADRHDLPRAMASCNELEHLHAPPAEVHVCAAVANLAWQRATDALDETSAALARAPNSFDARLTQGRAFEMALRPLDAITSLRAALGLRPDSVEAHVVLGRVLMKGSAKPEEGLAELRTAVRLGPSDPDALYELAMALAGPRNAPSDAAESLSLLTRATRERPPFTEAWLALGMGQLAAGNAAAAKDAADAVVRIEPGNVAALVLAGKVELANGRPDEALKDAQAALKVVRNSAAAVLLVADSNAKKGEVDLALEAYQSAWGLDHGNPDPLVHASQACHAATRDTSARAFGAKAVQEFPNYAPAWAALGDALAGQAGQAGQADQKETQDARDAYRKALAAPDDGGVDRGAIQAKLAALQ